MCAEVLLPLALLIPDIFDAEVLLINETGNVTLKRNLTDAMHYLLHTIIQMEARRDKKDELAETGFFTLNASHLKEIAGTHYAEAARILEKHNVVYRNHSYQVGFKSKGYTLIGKFAGADLKPVTLSDEGGTKERLSRWYEKQNKQNLEALSQIPYITKWFDSNRLTIDTQTAHDFVEFYSNGLRKLIPEETTSAKRRSIENVLY